LSAYAMLGCNRPSRFVQTEEPDLGAGVEEVSFAATLAARLRKDRYVDLMTLSRGFTALS